MNTIFNDIATFRLEQKGNLHIDRSNYLSDLLAIQEKLISSLNQAQKELYIKIEQLWCERDAYTEEQCYKDGFRDGVAMLCEALFRD